MTTQIRLLGWEARGLRCPDHRVSLEHNPGIVRRVSLVQMPNGTGKTTTLTLLRAALGGSGPSGGWTPDAIRELRKEPLTEIGHFAVSLMYGQHRLTFALNFDFDDGHVTTTTTLPSGKRDGFEPPRELRRFLNSDFVSFFVFDGELADSLLDRKVTNAQRVVDTLFQLGLLNQMAERVRDYWKDRTEEQVKAVNSSSQTTKGLKKWQGWIDRLRARLAFLEQEQKSLVEDVKRLRARHSQLKEENDQAIRAKKQFTQRLEAAERAVHTAEDQVHGLAARCLHDYRGPHNVAAPFARELYDLKRSLDRVKLPESTAREFFIELSNEPVCVCGRELDEAARLVVRERAQLYLASDDVALLNTIKADVAAQVGDVPDAHEEKLRELLVDLSSAIEKEGDARTARDAITTEAAKEDPAVEAKEREIEALREQIWETEKLLGRFEDGSEAGDIEDIWDLRTIRSRLKEAERKYAAIADTLRLKLQTEVLAQILEEAREAARVAISANLVDQTNELIARLMPNNRIRVEGIDRCLRLAEKSGGSAGETLGVAYAFLATLFSQSDYDLPFVVDSPAGPLDHPKRKALSELIPTLDRQFVAFTISTERAAFQDRLAQLLPDEIDYFTLFRKGDQVLEAEARRSQDLVESTDGLLVRGRLFFERFQLEAESN